MSPAQFRRLFATACALLFAASLLFPASAWAVQPATLSPAQQADSCNPEDYPGGLFPNATVAEKCAPGSPARAWESTGAGDPALQGNVTDGGAAQNGTLDDPPQCPCTIWDDSFTPTNAGVTDNSSIEVGVKFRSSIVGQISALRYYKGAGDTDTHVGHLWAADGTQLAAVIFTGESASGWQQMALATPVAIQANTTYIASIYTSPVGYFSMTLDGLQTARDNPPLRALANNEDGSNGVYKLGGGFPTEGSGNNYWVDVVFDTNIDTTPPAITQRIPAPAAGDVAVDANVIVQFSEAMAAATISAATITLRAADAGADLPATVTYNAATHTATLDPTSNLAYETTYQATVAGSVTDLIGNALGAPITWSFTTAQTPPPPPPGDDTAADFGAGSVGACYLSEAANGEIILAPAVGTEFSTTALPVGWDSYIWREGGEATFDGAVARVDDAIIATSGIIYGPGRALEFVATFAAAHSQHAGFGVDLSSVPYWAMFSTMDTGLGLYARTNNNGAVANTLLGNSYIGASHRYRIEWDAAEIKFYIDGALVHTQPVVITGNLRPLISDSNSNGPAIVVDWLHMSPYGSPCTFTSRVIDAGVKVDWLLLSSTGDRPAATGVAFLTRVGNSAVPDGSWSSWQAVGGGGAVVSPDGRYIQYQAQLSTTNPDVTPEVASVAITNGPANQPPVADNLSITTDEDAAAAVTLHAVDPEAGALTYSVLTQPVHGGLSGSAPNLTYTPAANYNGPDSFTYKANDGTADSNIATVSITVTPVNDAPVLAAIANQANAEGESVNLQLSAADIDGDSLTYNVAGLPTGLTYNANTGAIGGRISYTAAGGSPWSVTATVSDGKGGTDSKTFTWTVTDILPPRFTLPTLSDVHGSTINVPLTFSEATGFDGLLFAVHYNPAVLTPLAVTATDAGVGWSITPNLMKSGVVTVSMVTLNAVNGNGALVNLSFTVAGGPGAATALDFGQVEVNGEAVPPARLTNGNFSIPLANVAGAVRFWNDNVAVAGATLTLAGNATRTTASAADGVFGFANVTGGAWTLTPDKADGVRGISALDASLVLQSRANLYTLTPAEALAADINESGSVDEQDAIAILRVAVKSAVLPLSPGAHVWRFMPAARSYEPLLIDQAGQDFSAVLLGDVSGNWTPPAGVAAAPESVAEATLDTAADAGAVAAADAAILTLEANATPDGDFDLFFTLMPGAAPVYAVDLLLRYDAARLEIISVQAPQEPGQMVAVNLNQAGVARIGLASTTPLPGGRLVATMRVRASGDPLAALLGVEATGDERPIQIVRWAQSPVRIFLPMVDK